MTDEYNRPHFPLDMDDEHFRAWRQAPAAGQKAPRGTLVDASTGASVKLASLWRDVPLVIEFGSTT